MRWEDVDNDVDGGEWGNRGKIIIGESEKNKGKESQALPTEKKRGKHKSNHPDDEPAGEKNQLLLLLWWEMFKKRFNIIIIWFPPLPDCEIFIIKFPQFER